jgi:hypothetical protein
MGGGAPALDVVALVVSWRRSCVAVGRSSEAVAAMAMTSRGADELRGDKLGTRRWPRMRWKRAALRKRRLASADEAKVGVSGGGGGR